MKINKYRKIIAKLLLVVMLFALPVVSTGVVFAEAEDNEGGYLPDIILEANTSSGIVEDHYFFDLHIGNISLTKRLVGTQEQCTLCCDVTNMGSRKFKGSLRFDFYTETGYLLIEMIGFFGNELTPGETKTIYSSTNLDLMNVVTMSVQKHSLENKDINTSTTLDNVLEMHTITLSPFYREGAAEYWELRFVLRALQSVDYTLPDIFYMDIFFKNEMGDIEYQTLYLVEKNCVRENYYHAVSTNDSSVDFANICCIEIRASANPSPNTPGQTATPSITPPTPTATAQPASPTPSPTLPVIAKPSGTPVPTAQPQAPTPTRLPGITDMPTASPTARPTQTPSVSKSGKTKLMRPVIRIKIRKIYNKMWMAEIRLKKYQGTDIQIYYRRGKGKFKKIKLRRHNIKKNKKIFKVGYKKGNKIIYLRVRTYQKKGGKMWYSRYSKIRRLS